MSLTKCDLCEKFAVNRGRYCSNHNRARSNLEKKFVEWKSVYENVSWERYLETIISLKESGDLARAVAKEELRRGLDSRGVLFSDSQQANHKD